MAYERTTWKPDDLVTSGKMNNIETAIVELNTVNATSDERIEANETAINSINEKIGENNGTIGTINERIKINADNIEINENKITLIDEDLTNQINSIQQNYVLSDNALQTQIDTLNNKGVTGYKGQYNEETSYKLGDIVSDNANFYIYVNDESSNGQALNDNTTYWQEVNTALTGSIIEVGENEPENDNVKLWISTGKEVTSYEVPTMTEFDILSATVNTLRSFKYEHNLYVEGDSDIAVIDLWSKNMGFYRHICGEVSNLTIKFKEHIDVDVVFTSGNNPTNLTITPPEGTTIKWANGFNPNSIQPNTTYELIISEGLGIAILYT